MLLMSVTKILQHIPQGIFRNKLYKEINSNRIKHKRKENYAHHLRAFPI